MLAVNTYSVSPTYAFNKLFYEHVSVIDLGIPVLNIYYVSCIMYFNTVRLFIEIIVKNTTFILLMLFL